MTVVFIAIAALVILGMALVLSGVLDPSISGSDRPPAPELPQGCWTADDLHNLRFRVGVRGYRMADVDAALAALASQLPTAQEPQQVTTDVPPPGPASTPTD